MHRSSALLAVLAATAFACPADSAASTAQGPWAQCGGMNWTGGTTCQAGWSCQAQNPYYSQCLQGSSGGSPSSAAAASPASSSKAASSPSTVAHAVSSSTTAAYVAPTTAASSKTAVTTTASSSKAATSTSAPSTGNSGLTYKTSITYYGAGDTFGSGNCNTNTVACFFYTNPGYAAAVSQNLYGAGDGQGQGPGCGTCWKLTAQTDSSGNKLSNAGNSIVVMVNNLCPADSNPLCSQPTTSDVNQYGANVNFDLCRDSGAAAALFGSSGVGLAVGTAQQVDCSQWSGTIVH